MLLRERRAIRVRAVEGGVELEWSSLLTAAVDVEINSPGSKGRAGAGYGGWFWRLPELDPGQVEVFTRYGSGEEEVNGSRAEWLAVAVGGAAPWTAVVSGPAEPWFVRVGQYQGVGSALAWDRARVVGAGEELRVEVRLALYDGVRAP
ncbi:DUF6807 family protein [Actinosynnema sp. CA-248983]